MDINKQKKIGEFLSNVDKQIELIEKEIKIENEVKKIFLFFIYFNSWENNKKAKINELIIKNSEKNVKNINYPVESISNKYGFINQEEYFDKKSIASLNKKNYYMTKKNNCF